MMAEFRLFNTFTANNDETFLPFTASDDYSRPAWYQILVVPYLTIQGK